MGICWPSFLLVSGKFGLSAAGSCCQKTYTEKVLVLVICPLKSIVEDQIKEVENFGIKAKSISELELGEEVLSKALTKPNNGIYNTQNSQQTWV